VRATLVAAEMALALVLLVGASLLLQSVWRRHQVDLGYRTDSTLTFRVELGWAAYGSVEKTLAFNRERVDRLRDLPTIPGDGHPDRARSCLRRPGSGGHAARGRRQPAAGRPLLARP
jgi:hypothetical protein